MLADVDLERAEFTLSIPNDESEVNEEALAAGRLMRPRRMVFATLLLADKWVGDYILQPVFNVNPTTA
jgi:hypothetical protein